MVCFPRKTLNFEGSTTEPKRVTQWAEVNIACSVIKAPPQIYVRFPTFQNNKFNMHKTIES